MFKIQNIASPSIKLRPFKSIIACLMMALSTIWILSPTVAYSQTYNPLRYWTFDKPNPLEDDMGNFHLDPSYYQSGYKIINNAGAVGNGLELDASSDLIRAGLFDVDREFTIEFLFKPGYLFNATTFFKRIDGAIEARMEFPKITFITQTNKSSGGWHVDEFMVDLDQVGRRSYGYFMDGNWHHIVFKYNAGSGQKQIWIDGQLPDGYSTVTPTGYFTNNSSTNRDLLINTSSNYLKYHGQYDEIALYKYELPDQQIYRHYIDFQQKKHYTHQAYTGNVPSPDPVTAGNFYKDYAPGHPNVNVSTNDQLLGFPTPRYKSNHTLHPNVPLYGVEYLGGLLQPGVTNIQALENSKVQQADLVPNFNYSLLISSNSHEYPYYNDTTKFAGYFLKQANLNPSWHTSIFTFWPQINPEIAGFKQRESYLTCGCLNPTDYLRNSSGQYLDLYGNPGSQKTLSPAARIDSVILDGQTQRYYLQQLVNNLQRPLDMIFENGELIPFYNNSSVLSKDPNVISDKNNSGLDWKTYEGRRAKEKINAYRNQFMSLPQLSNTTFAYFQVDGQPNWRLKYSEMRSTNTQLNSQYYPTGDIYMRYPSNWRYWTSAWHGWQWVAESRHVEIPLGDKLFSPPVAPGWDVDPEKNVRPAQWLGMLKAFSMSGAEFFYTSFFNLTQPFPDAKNWVWQVAMPSYAQAVSSRYEDLYRNGFLMEGDVPNDYINPSWNAYSFKSGDLRKLVVARKHNTKARYAITGTIQPNTNMAGAVEDESLAKITLDGQELTFMVRRQGSTYIYDKSISSDPVFYQLDGWHENSHPYFWSKNFTFEAELYDNTPSNTQLKTTVPNGTPQGDYSDYTTMVQMNSGSTISFDFQTRLFNPSTYYVWVRAKSRSGSSTGFEVGITTKGSYTIDCITNTSWDWYRLDINDTPSVFNGLTSGKDMQLFVTALNGNLDIDKIVLTNNSGAVYGNTANQCTGDIPEITASGSNRICLGESVTLTSTHGDSYSWSNGQTTQSIVVSTAGNYWVSVVNGGSSATSLPLSVWTISPPSATITPQGSTTFCTGSSLKLVSSWANFYQWSNGATSKNISVNSSGPYSVTVVNKQGCSATSAPINIVVNNCTGTCDQPYNLVTVNVASTYAELEWTAPNTFETGFNVKLKNMTTGYVYVTGTVPNTTTAMGVGIVGNSDYRWWVRSRCGSQKSAYAGFLTFDTHNNQRNVTSHHEQQPVLTPLTILEDGSPEINIDVKDFMIHPNPTHDLSTISFKSDNRDQLDLTLIDMTGKTVHSDVIQSIPGVNLYDIDLSGLNAGIFMIRLQNTHHNWITRVVKN